MICPSIQTYARFVHLSSCGGLLPDGWSLSQSRAYDNGNAEAYSFQYKNKDTIIVYIVHDIQETTLREKNHLLFWAFSFYVQVQTSLPKRAFIGLTGQRQGGSLAAFVSAHMHRSTSCSFQLQAHVFDTPPRDEAVDLCEPFYIQQKLNAPILYYHHRPDVYLMSSPVCIDTVLSIFEPSYVERSLGKSYDTSNYS